MTSFRWTPGCCCSQKQEADVCVPECALIADRIVLATEEMTIDAAISASRHCANEDFWHGFYAYGFYVWPLTVETVSVNGTNRARAVANSVVSIVSYADGTGKGAYIATPSETYALYYFSTVLNSSNATQADVDNYFYFDSFDNRVHYRPAVQEPAWVRIAALPYDFDNYPFHFEYDGTEAGYAAAREVHFDTPPKYLTAAECGVPLLVCSSDFTDDATAWAQYHTGTSECYSINGEDLDGWINSLADGTHHYGAEKFYVLRMGAYRSSWGMSGGKPSPDFPQAFSDVTEYRFNRDAPTFTPMAPTAVYSVDRVYEHTNNRDYPGVTGYDRRVYGSPSAIPANWKWNPFETPGDFWGTYYALAAGVSHRPIARTAARNGVMPLGRYIYTPPAAYDGAFPRVSSQGYPAVFCAQATLDKAVSAWTAEDWGIFNRANRAYAQGSLRYPSNMWNVGTGKPTLWSAWWRRPTARIYGTTNTSPAGMLSNGHAWAWQSPYLTAVFRNGSNTYESTGTHGIGTSAAAPSAAYSLISDTDATFYGFDTSPYNKYGKIEFFSNIVQSYEGGSWVPEITSAVINEVIPSTFYVLTNVFADQTDRTFYVFPLVYCAMIGVAL